MTEPETLYLLRDTVSLRSQTKAMLWKSRGREGFNIPPFLLKLGSRDVLNVHVVTVFYTFILPGVRNWAFHYPRLNVLPASN